MKLLRKDVLKWIKNLQSGRYKKGKSYLVSKDGTKFCCLGVWADIHGATWEEGKLNSYDVSTVLCPIAPGRRKALSSQKSSYLVDPKLARGLQMGMQRSLANLNDESKGFSKVVDLIKKEVLPR